MEYRKRDTLPEVVLPGRMIANAVGKGAPIESCKMTVGFGKYCAEAGPMEPHHHAEETVYIVDAHRGRVRYGGTPDNLLHQLTLEPGMVLHFDELEWHVFEYDQGGLIEIIFIYGQTDQLRPEEITLN